MFEEGIDFSQVKLERSDENVTGKIGLSWIVHSLKHFGMEDMIRRFEEEPKSNREIKKNRKIIAGALTIISGGDTIEDVENLRVDRGLLKSLGWKDIVAADTLRDFIKNKRNSGIIRKTNELLAIKVMVESELEEFTYDNDATYFDSEKDCAEYSYQKSLQFSGLLGFIPELGICNTAEFRKGNISPSTGILNQLRKAEHQAQKAGKRIRRFRSDSAAHQNSLFRECRENDIKYFISLDKNASIKEIIEKEREASWGKLSGKYEDQVNTQWREDIYVTNKGESMRILILRWPKKEVTLFDKSPYNYHVIGTNDNEVNPMKWLEIHNGRMSSENYNKELKNGFNCDYTPSHNYDMNRGYFLMSIIAYNMVQITKLFYLDNKEARKWTIKTMRYRFINICGKMIKTGRRYICKIINVTELTYDLYRNCKAKLIIQSSLC